MVILMTNNKCLLTDSRSFEEYDLIAELENNLKAHWDFRSEGKAKRYYIGSLLVDRDYDEIEWSEMCKKRKTDKWLRIDSDKLQDMTPRQWLEAMRKKRATSKSKYVTSRTKLVRKAQQPQGGGAQSRYRNHPQSMQRRPYQQQHAQSQYGYGGGHGQRQRYDNGGGYGSNEQNTRYYDRYNDRYDDPYRKSPDQYESRQRDQAPNGQSSSKKTKYVLKPKGSESQQPSQQRRQQGHGMRFQDPAIVSSGKEERPRPRRYQTAHKPLKGDLKYYAEYHPKPRRTKLRFGQVHQPRHGQRSDAQYNSRNRNRNDRQPAIVDAYMKSERGQRDPRDRRGKKDKKSKRDKRRNNRFATHLTKEETDRVLEDTASFQQPIVYTGEVSLSRYNPSVAYVSVDGLDRDIRISGFVDRNRAFQGDIVTVSIYPEVEWMQAIRQEVMDFKNVLDQRDADKARKLAEEEMEDEDDEEETDVNEVLLDGHRKSNERGTAKDEYTATSSSGDSTGNDHGDGNGDGMEHRDEPAQRTESGHDDESNNQQDAPQMDTAKKGDDEKKEDGNVDPDEKSQEIMFNKMGKKRIEELVDRESVTAYDHYRFLTEMAADFAKFEEKWPSMEITDDDHPRREYMDSVMQKCGGKTPQSALDDFEWPSPSDHPDKLPRGRVLGIYESNKTAKEMVPGYLLPMIRNQNGEMDQRWAIFTPSDKRYPKALFPMRELPKSLKKLFRQFEQEELRLLNEWDRKKHALRRQNKRTKDVKKGVNRFNEELKLRAFEMSFENKWPDHCFMPVCHFKKTIGKRGAVETETKHILSNHNITWGIHFGKKIEDFVKDFTITEKDYVGRRDVRHLRVFTIDPTSARDFDDALSIEEMKGEEDGSGKKLYRIGIHIADVTHFVEEGTILDDEAKNRATSVYLVDRCLPMLPHHLCQNLCSLNPDVDRLAYSVFVVLNEEGHLVSRTGTADDPYSKSPWFGRTVIRSRARLNYETAHWMLIDKVTADTPLEDLDECCSISKDTELGAVVRDTKLFWSIAKAMRARRFESGSVSFFRPHVRFRLDKKDKSKALAFGPEILLWSNNLVEEMMLLANQLVANQLMVKVRRHALLRKHPAPLREKSMKLRLICRSQNVQLKMTTPKELNNSLRAMQDVSFEGITMDKAVNALMAQTMQRATYVVVEDQEESDYKHWALNFPIYTHFTSPIRRYADVIVHRLLSYTIFMDNQAELDKRGLELPHIESVKKQCEVCNKRNANAHYAEIDSQHVHLCLVLMERPIVVDAMVIDMNNGSFNVVIPGLGLDLRVKVKDCIEMSNGELMEIEKKGSLPDAQLVITWTDGTVEEVPVFGKIRIRLSSRLKLPIDTVVTIIEPSKRKYLKAANASAVGADDENKVDEEESENDVAALRCDVENENEEESIRNAEVGGQEVLSPVAMTLESQLKVGAADFHIGHYD